MTYTQVLCRRNVTDASCFCHGEWVSLRLLFGSHSDSRSSCFGEHPCLWSIIPPRGAGEQACCGAFWMFSLPMVCASTSRRRNPRAMPRSWHVMPRFVTNPSSSPLAVMARSPKWQAALSGQRPGWGSFRWERRMSWRMSWGCHFRPPPLPPRWPSAAQGRCGPVWQPARPAAACSSRCWASASMLTSSTTCHRR